jgi:hypothetical protein
VQTLLAIMSQTSGNRLVYISYALFAVVTSYVISQLGFLAMLITASIMVSGVLLWRKKRPQDFTFVNHLPRVFATLTFALVFVASYLIVRETQPTNYRVEHLAALAAFSVLLALYFALISVKKRSR